MLNSNLRRPLAVVLAVTASLATAGAGNVGGAAGTGWDTFGAPGNGVNQFAGPVGLFVNSARQIFLPTGRTLDLFASTTLVGGGGRRFVPPGPRSNRFTCRSATLLIP